MRFVLRLELFLVLFGHCWSFRLSQTPRTSLSWIPPTKTCSNLRSLGRLEATGRSETEEFKSPQETKIFGPLTPEVSGECNRRAALTKGASAAASILLWHGNSPTATAYRDDDYDDDNGGIIDSNRGDGDEKVVLRTSKENLPAMPPSSSSSSVSSESEEAVLSEYETRRIKVFERAAPSVVYIDTFTEQRDAFSTNVMEVPLGAGSGFVWDDRGHIVTNFHVVRAARSAQVAILTRKFYDSDTSTTSSKSKGSYRSTMKQLSSIPSSSIGSRRQQQLMQRSTIVSDSRNDADVTDYTRKVYQARVVGVDPDKDVAVLKVDAPVFDLHPIDVGVSRNLKVGQTALAIGNPFGLDHTLTVGVVSGTGREVRSPNGRPITNTIQSDAAINPGNSGGPLLDSSGKLIGMNTAIYSPSGGSAGIGFAIPVDTLKFVVETLIRDGRIIRPVIGISYLESKQARTLGISRGVLILDVPPNSNAYKAGLRGTKRSESGLIEIGDIIIRVEDKRVDKEADLFEALEMYKPGDRVRITVNRVDVAPTNGRQPTMKEVTVTTQLRASAEVAPVSAFW